MNVCFFPRRVGIYIFRKWTVSRRGIDYSTAANLPRGDLIRVPVGASGDVEVEYGLLEYFNDYKY